MGKSEIAVLGTVNLSRSSCHSLSLTHHSFEDLVPDVYQAVELAILQDPTLSDVIASLCLVPCSRSSHGKVR